MLNFKKYSSIENSYSKEFIEKPAMDLAMDLEYVVQEKVHGSRVLVKNKNAKFAEKKSAKSLRLTLLPFSSTAVNSGALLPISSIVLSYYQSAH